MVLVTSLKWPLQSLTSRKNMEVIRSAQDYKLEVHQFPYKKHLKRNVNIGDQVVATFDLGTSTLKLKRAQSTTYEV